MLALTEIRAMEDALKAHAAYVAALREEYDNTSRFDIFSNTRERARTIWEEAQANQDRFIGQRNYLIETEPSDHEAVAEFVAGLRKIAGSPLPNLVAAERDSNATTTIVGGALVDTAKDIGTALKFGVPTILIGAAIVAAIIYWPQIKKAIGRFA